MPRRGPRRITVVGVGTPPPPTRRILYPLAMPLLGQRGIPLDADRLIGGVIPGRRRRGSVVDASLVAVGDEAGRCPAIVTPPERMKHSVTTTVRGFSWHSSPRGHQITDGPQMTMTPREQLFGPGLAAACLVARWVLESLPFLIGGFDVLGLMAADADDLRTRSPIDREIEATSR